MFYMIANAVLAILPPTRFFGIKRIILRLLGISVGDGAMVCGAVKFYGSGRVSIGQRSWVGPHTQFHTDRGSDIHIGADCDIAPAVIFAVGSHQIGGPGRRAGKGCSAPIRVGNGTWIGVRATLLGGADVKDSCIIGAGALLLGKTFEASSLIYGTPAKIVRDLPAEESPMGCQQGWKR